MTAAYLAVTILCFAAAAAAANSAPPPPTDPTEIFGFSYAFGDGMVLQQAPAKAAVYGWLPTKGTAVTVTVSSAGKTLYTVDATVSPTATKQAYGKGFGIRPCNKEDCPPYNMAGWNPWNTPQNSFKALLKPTAATVGAAPQEYTITATCTAGCEGGNTTETLTGVVFGDMWYCSGQSNMWLPVDHSFSRNETVDAIKAGKYSNVRGMFGPSATKPSGGNQNPGDYNLGGTGYARPRLNGRPATSPWLTAKQAVATGSSSAKGGSYPLFKMGAACWYFGQRLSELGVAAPIGLVDTAIGGQRIEEFMQNVSIYQCTNRSSENIPYWNGELYAQMVLPFVDMTVKGWVWYQGENNMGSPKGSSDANLGYSCEQRVLIEGWRQAWSETPGTTDPLAPFGVVTLASSGAEGSDAAMGAMRIAQTAGYGTLPSPALPNTFLAQAYDLDDEWGPAMGPCFQPKSKGGLECCLNDGKAIEPPAMPPTPSPPNGPICTVSTTPAQVLNQTAFDPKSYKLAAPLPVNVSTTSRQLGIEACCAICAKNTNGCKYWEYNQDRAGPKHGKCILKQTLGVYKPDRGGRPGQYSKWSYAGGVMPLGPPKPAPPPVCSPADWKRCTPACQAAMNTPVAMGGIHPRSKKPVGDRLGSAAFNLVYGGKGAVTGPTLSGCVLSTDGKTLTIKFNASLLRGDKIRMQKYAKKGTPNRYGIVGGSYLDVQTNASNFCMESAKTPSGERYCPKWAGGDGKPSAAAYDQGWVLGLDFALGSDAASIDVDLSHLNGSTPTAVRYAWSIVNCCDLTDPDLYVTKPCGPASCPIMMENSPHPANPFLAKIVGGKCECIAPQVCDA